eukprot:TRINITY_DN53373_c0_g1_i1.p1 TRINITY_DN53373_c0_g1~~TRINITY_DN53373_c0_g1_i1.p1  ORF type:complete len:380 (+),score=81.06 TRINITY_DN53373_c0_g1_i1:64-1203(+)
MGCCTSKAAEGAGDAFTDLSEVDKKSAKEQNRANAANAQRKQDNKNAANGSRGLSQYETNGAAPIAEPTPEPAAPEEPAQDETNNIKLSARPTNIVEARARKPPTQKEPAAQEAATVVANSGETKVAEPQNFAPPAVDSQPQSATQPATALASFPTQKPEQEDDEEAEMRKKREEVKEEMKREGREAKQGFAFGGLDEEEPVKDPNNASADIQCEEIQQVEAVEDGPSPMKNDPDNAPAEGAFNAALVEENFPSEEWFKKNNYACPTLNWSQDLTTLTIKPQLSAPPTKCEVIEPFIWVYECAVGDNNYGLRLVLEGEVIADKVEQKTEGGKTLITLHKKHSGKWRNLIQGPSIKVATLSWIDMDWVGDSDDEDDELEL